MSAGEKRIGEYEPAGDAACRKVTLRTGAGSHQGVRKRGLSKIHELANACDVSCLEFRL